MVGTHQLTQLLYHSMFLCVCVCEGGGVGIHFHTSTTVCHIPLVREYIFFQVPKYLGPIAFQPSAGGY